MMRQAMVGVDLGGTRIRVLASGRRARRLQAPAPALTGLPRFLAGLWRRWGLARGDVAALVVAARGVWTPGERREEERRLRHLARRVRAMSDAEAAFLAALGEGAGLLILAGTGSIVLGRSPGGRWARAGGLGPLLGDEGSAFSIGRWWLLTTRGAEARRMARIPDAVSRVAGLAQTVLRRARGGDRRARVIVRSAQEILAALACQVIDDLRLPSPVRVSWAGRLMEDPAFRSGVWRALRLHHHGRRLRVVPPAHTPVEAAHALARLLAERARR
jgi:N-acetylglucosamine kinase-like BadF-type ATPase